METTEYCIKCPKHSVAWVHYVRFTIINRFKKRNVFPKFCFFMTTIRLVPQSVTSAVQYHVMQRMCAKANRSGYAYLMAAPSLTLCLSSHKYEYMNLLILHLPRSSLFASNTALWAWRSSRLPTLRSWVRIPWIFVFRTLLGTNRSLFEARFNF